MSKISTVRGRRSQLERLLIGILYPKPSISLHFVDKGTSPGIVNGTGLFVINHPVKTHIWGRCDRSGCWKQHGGLDKPNVVPSRLLLCVGRHDKNISVSAKGTNA